MQMLVLVLAASVLAIALGWLALALVIGDIPEERYIGWSAWCIWQDLRTSRQDTPVSRATLQAITLRESRQGWTDGPTWRLRGGQR